MYYLDFLSQAHHRLQPRSYLEIGVRWGHSLALARCPAVGVDPAFEISAELSGHFTLARTTSDEYFSRSDPLAPVEGQPFDLSFIDGLHLFEFAYRDFMFAETHSTSRGVIILDDVLPRSVDEAARERHTQAWTGDVFRVLSVLAEFRPELIAVPVDTRPTGLLMVFGLDPQDRTLQESYADIMAAHRRADPQDVPARLLDRSSVVSPHRFLSSGVLEALALADGDPADVRANVAPVVARTLGRGFVDQ